MIFSKCQQNVFKQLKIKILQLVEWQKSAYWQTQKKIHSDERKCTVFKTTFMASGNKRGAFLFHKRETFLNGWNFYRFSILTLLQLELRWEWVAVGKQIFCKKNGLEKRELRIEIVNCTIYQRVTFMRGFFKEAMSTNPLSPGTSSCFIL